MRPGLSSIVLWLTFAAIVVASAVVLLRACGMVTPSAAALPVFAWNFCPSTPPAVLAEAERGSDLRKLLHRLERELADKALACASLPPPPTPPLELPTRAGAPRPQQTALLKPPPPPPPPPPPKPKPPLDAERWNNKDLGMLKGCWQLGRESLSNLAMDGRSEQCRVPAGSICFGENGTGRRQMTQICPTGGTVTCVAPITASFGNDGSLSTTQPQVVCSDGRTTWNERPNLLTCRRVNDALAVCRDSFFEHEFRR